MDDFQNSMMEIFSFETGKFLDDLEKILLDCEDTGQSIRAHVPEIFRIMHTIKSSSAMMSFNNISKLAHSIEDLFYYIRENNPENINEGRLTDVVFDCIDFIKNNMQNSDGESPSAKIEFIGKVLDEIKNPATAATAEAASSSADDTASVNEIPKKTDEGSGNTSAQTHNILVFFKSGCPMLGMRAFELETKIKKIAKSVTTFPENISNDGEDIVAKDGFYMEISADCPFEEIEAVIKKSVFVDHFERDAVRKDTVTPTAPAIVDRRGGNTDDVVLERRGDNTDAPALTERRSDSISSAAFANVAVHKLDDLVNLVGEIIVADMAVSTNFEQNDRERMEISITNMHKLIIQMQEIALSLRMYSLKETFQKQHRILRDICRKQNKEVEFLSYGENTEVDRSVIDNISSPLMHLMRNAIDHGIEDPNERAASGKPPKGKVELSACTEGRDVVITISDDGKGLNKDRIVEKALEKGLVTPEQIDTLSDSEMQSLILMPGFSTKEAVSEYSGRGVGMDVVNSSIKQLGGRMTLISENGVGTKITLRIPLTLTVVDAVIVRAGNEIFAVPTTSVIEIFKMDSSMSIRSVNDANTVLVGNACYRIVSMFDFYGVTEAPAYDDGMMLIVKSDHESYVLFADEVVNQLNIVLKPVPDMFKAMKPICGCTILGDGEISLVIDTNEMYAQ